MKNSLSWTSPLADEPEISGLLQSIALESVPQGVLIAKHSGTGNAIVYCNQAFERLSGYSREQLLGRDCHLLQGRDTDPAEGARLAQAMARNESCSVTLKNYRQDGTPFWNKISMNPASVDSAGARYFVCIQEDVTEQLTVHNRERQQGMLLEESLNEIYIFAADTLQFLQVNHGARVNLGYTMDELAGMTPVDIKPEFTAAQFSQMLEPLRTAQEEKLVFYTVHERKDGSHYPVEVHLQCGLFDSAQAYVAIILDISERYAAEARLRDSYKDLRAMAGRLQTVRDEERKRLARELHDDLGQLIAAARIDLSTLTSEMPNCSNLAAESISSLDVITNRAVQAIRGLVKDLRPSLVTDAGLFAGIEMLVTEFGRRTAIATRFSVHGQLAGLPDGMVTPVFRLIQESLNNVAKHARATEADVSLDRSDNELTLRVRDNGVGTTVHPGCRRNGFGLTGMQERVDILGGRFSFTSAPGQGAEVLAVLPIRRST